MGAPSPVEEQIRRIVRNCLFLLISYRILPAYLAETIDMQSVPTKPCKVCGEKINARAYKCIHCDSYQDWHAYINFGNTLLSLMVALFAVLTVAVPIINDALTAKNSEISLSFQGASTEGVGVLVTNSGVRPGIVHAPAILNIIQNGKGVINIPLLGQLATIIEPAKSTLLGFGLPGDSGPAGTTLSSVFGQTNGLIVDLERASCTLIVETSDFRSQGAKNKITVTCAELQSLLGNLNDRLARTGQKQ